MWARKLSLTKIKKEKQDFSKITEYGAEVRLEPRSFCYQGLSFFSSDCTEKIEISLSDFL